MKLFPKKVANTEFKSTVCWDATNAVKKQKIIRKVTKFPEFEEYELIYSGPHFYVSQPFYKTPRKKCTKKGHYDVIDLTFINEEYVPRTNFIPNEEIGTYIRRITVFDDKNLWIDNYKVGFSKMLNIEGERTLQGAILPPKVAHIHALISVVFKDTETLLEFCGLTSSLLMDFFIKSVGASNLTDGRISAFPMNISSRYKPHLFIRVLLLNCLTIPFKRLWENNWNEAFKTHKWTKQDKRLKAFSELTSEWSWNIPLRNYFERRQALLEIDVIACMALGLSLEDLITMYIMFFPVLRQNENDTWYDRKGNIVFTCSKGLTGVGMDRKEWNHIKGLNGDEMIDCTGFEHMECNAQGEITYSITKSELYNKRQVTYFAPFDRCDRVEDYKLAWAHFEKVFNKE